MAEELSIIIVEYQELTDCIKLFTVINIKIIFMKYTHMFIYRCVIVQAIKSNGSWFKIIHIFFKKNTKKHE
ncbi:hypothetical protein QTP88_005867 [Uroleucon formosanum]